jgi:hypothetical protein
MSFSVYPALPWSDQPKRNSASVKGPRNCLNSRPGSTGSDGQEQPYRAVVNVGYPE